MSTASRFAFRRVLPIVQMMLALALIGVGHFQNRAFYGQWNAAEEAQTERLKQIIQEKNKKDGFVYWDIRNMWNGFTPTPWLIVSGINLPVLGVAGVPAAILPERIAWSIFLLGVGVFWYLLGRAFDKRFGLLPGGHYESEPAPSRRELLIKFMTLVGLLVSVVVLGSSIGSGVTFRLLVFAVVFWSCVGAAYQIGLWFLLRAAKTGGT